MKKITLLYFLFFVFISGTYAQERPFISTWKTDVSNPTNRKISLFADRGLHTFNYNVDWGDGNSDTNVDASISHTYDVPGTYKISITGRYPVIGFKHLGSNQLLEINQWGTQQWEELKAAFVACKNMDVVATDTPNLKGITSTVDMFNNCENLKGNEKFNDWDMSTITDMRAMFYGAKAFNQDLDHWDVSNVISLSQMFYEAESFNGAIGSWDVSNTTNLSQMFFRAKAFNQNIGDWNVSRVTRMNKLFFETNAFNQNIGHWDVSGMINLNEIFSSAFAFNQDISSWDVSNAKFMESMFKDARAFNRDLSGWDVGKVTNMASMFRDAKAFNQNLGNWDVSSLQSAREMFLGVTLDTDNYDSLLKGWSDTIPLSNGRGGIIHGGNSQYCKGELARQKLTDDLGWTITDGGKADDCTEVPVDPEPLICPSSQIVLTTQQQVDAFATTYDIANCTFDQGIKVEGADITNLNGLSGLVAVNGSLVISGNPVLTDMSGLSTLISVGGNLQIYSNASLENFNGLSSLTSAGGNMLISRNAVLSDMSGLSELANVGGSLNISKNPVLSNCEIALICDATVVTGDSNIYQNTGDCADLATAEAFCSGEPDGQPIVDAGEDQIIVLPTTSSAIFSGTANDPDGGTVVSLEWTQTEGPDTAVLSGGNTATLEVTGLITGSYKFRLTVTDDQGETGFDEVILEVLSEGSSAPIVNAGQDRNSTESSITLNGNGSDPDGGDVVFLWTQESGPSTAVLSGSDTAELVASNLIIGDYIFKLTVADDENETSFDEVTVTITDEAPALTCPANQIVLSTQQEVDAFATTYDVANCAFDQGIKVEGADITNLNGLSGLVAVNGSLVISGNPVLTDMGGLSTLISVGGNLQIYSNASLENFNGLSSLTSAGGNMLISRNAVLSDMSGLSELTALGGGLNISKNPVLSNCEIALICDATVVTGDSNIYQNTGDCADLATAEAACSGEPEQRPFVTTWKTDNPGDTNDNQITLPTIDDNSYEYNYTVDWGDGQTDTGITGSLVHTYNSPGTYQVSITGDFPHIYFNGNPNGGDRDKIISVDQWGDIVWQSMQGAFSFCENLDVVATDTPDLSNVESMHSMFFACPSLIGNESFNSWDVSNVEDMMAMFANSTFDQDIGSWNTGNVWDMSYMFQDASFNKDISMWDVSGVVNLSGMFLGSKAFDQDLSVWDVSNVTDMSIMFWKAGAFDQDLGAWNIGNVTTLRDIFSDSNMSIENYDKTLQGWSNLPTLKNNVSIGAANIQFCIAEEARQKLMDDFGWTITDGGKAADCEGTSPIVNAGQDRNSTESSITLNGNGSDPDGGDVVFLWTQESGPSNAALSGSETANLTASNLIVGDYIFKLTVTDDENETSFDEVAVSITLDEPNDGLFITTWKTDIRGNSQNDQVTIEYRDAGNYTIDWGDGTIDSNVDETITHTYAAVGTYQISISGDYPRITFGDSGDAKKLISVDQWGDTAWSTMEAAFARCINVRILAIDNPDLSNVTSMKYMFSNADSMNEDISDWDVSNVTTFQSMFYSADNYNQNISNWNLGDHVRMDYLLYKAGSFDQDLSTLNIASISKMKKMLSETNMSTANYDATLIGWSAQSGLRNDISLGAVGVEYCASELSREGLVNDFGWTISDDGKALDCNSGLTSKTVDISNQAILSPNPAITTTNLSFKKPVQMQTIQVFDVLGRLVTTYEGPEIDYNGTYILNVNFIPAGTYFIKSQDAHGNQFQKQMVIEK